MKEIFTIQKCLESKSGISQEVSACIEPARKKKSISPVDVTMSPKEKLSDTCRRISGVKSVMIDLQILRPEWMSVAKTKAEGFSMMLCNNSRN